MNDSTLRPNDGTIRPGADNNSDNGSTLRPSDNDNGATLRPSADNGATLRPGADNGATLRPGTDNGATLRPSTDSGATLRPGADNGATLRSGTDSGATLRPGADNGATLRPGNGSGSAPLGGAAPSGSTSGSPTGTIRPNTGNATQARPQQRQPQQSANTANTDYKTQKGAIFGLPDIFIEGKKLHVIEYLKQVSGEAQLIKVESKGKQYMLKLYLSGIHPNHDMLEKVKSIPQALHGLMRLYKHGTWTHPTDANDIRDYEIMELCEGGTLSDLNLKGDEEKWKKLAMQMAVSIDLCHKRGFLHLDVKPDNFLFVGKNHTDLVLGDFGLAVAMDSNGKGQAPQARTKKYAAPEIYTRIDGPLVEVSDKSDFYSLGMSLMRLWMGEAEFNKIFEGKNERQLANIKQFNKLQIPTTLSKHSQSLLKALLIGNEAERAGFNDIQRWINGENLVEEAEASQDIPQMNIVYNGAKNQVAHSMSELAQFMLEDKDLAKKYLYSGKLSKLIDQTNPEMALDIDQITEEWYPSNKDAGLAAAIFTLDEDYPWTDCTGKQMNTFAEIAESLLYNFDQYFEDLKNKEHTFYVYLRVNDAQDWVESIHKQLAKGAQDNLLRFIYHFNGKLPFRIVDKDKKIHYCNHIDDILQYGLNLSEESKWEITCGGFTKWVNSRNGMIAAEIENYLKQEKWATECYPGVLYLLNKKCDYDFHIVNDVNDPKALFTPAQLATRLNKLVSDYGKSSNQYVYFQEFLNIDTSRLGYYLRARGFGNQINYIKYCFDPKCNDSQRQPGPYNNLIAAYKCIAGMGCTPYYIYKGKKLTTLADANKLSAAEKKAEYTGKCFGDWLAVLFQENPKLNRKKAYTYELETEKYLKYIESFHSNEQHVSRFRMAVNKTTACVDRVVSLRKRAATLKWLVILLGLLPLGVLAIYSCIAGLPFEGNPLSPFNETIFAVLFIISTIGVFAMSEGSGSCIGELIWGVVIAAAIYWGLYFLLKLLMPLAGYITGALLALYAWKMYKTCIDDVQISSKTNLLGTTELVVNPLHFAFKSSESISNFTPTVALTTGNEESYLEKAISKIKKKTFWSVITSILITAMFIFMGATKSLIFSSSSSEVATLLKGSWNGEFQGKPATLVIDEVDENEMKVHGTMMVKFKKLAKESVSGYVTDSEQTSLVLTDDVQNGILDGSYSITLDKNAGSMTIHYVNQKTGKDVDFTLVKDIQDNANETEPEPEVVETTTKPQTKSTETKTTTQTSTPSTNEPKTTTTTAPKPTGKGNINVEASSSQHNINSNGSGNKQKRSSAKQNSNGGNSNGGFKLEPTSSSSSNGGFKLEPTSSSSSNGGFKLEVVE